MKVVFATLYLGDKPHPAFQKSLTETLPLIEEEGWQHALVVEANCPYISAARSKVLRKALDAEADFIVYLDYDVSWTPETMVKLLSTPGDVIAGTYRKKSPQIEYMGSLIKDSSNNLVAREDGCLLADKIPAGFLKISKYAVDKFAKAYPELLFGSPMKPELDMFNHGVLDGIWHGEDYAFSKRWNDKCGQIWIVPDLDIHHHKGEAVFEGNFHKYLMSYNKPVPIDAAPLVSVVIPAYNYAQYVEEAIQSVLDQTYKNVEVIVVNDGSTDNTAGVVTPFMQYGVSYIYQPNQGAATARNRGITQARGEWIVCLDADDKLKPTYIEECLKVPEADIISTAMQYFGDRKGVHNFSEKPNYYDFCANNNIHCASMFRKDVWQAVEGFDSNLHSVYDDWEFWLHATKLGYEVRTISKPLFMYRKHGTSKIDEAQARHDELYGYIKSKHGVK